MRLTQHLTPLACMIAPILLILSGCQTAPKSGKPSAASGAESRNGVSAEDSAKVEAYFQANDTRFMPPQTATSPLTPENGFMLVDLDAQRAYLYADGKLIAASKVSSGKTHHRTETGEYIVGEKSPDHHSTVYGNFVDASGDVVVSNVDTRVDFAPAGSTYKGASMQNFLRLNRGKSATAMGLHAGVLPGYPASHGCIRLPKSASEFYYATVPLGMPIHVRGEKYGVPYGTKQPGGKSVRKTPRPAPTPAVPVAPIPGSNPDTTPETTPAPPDGAVPAIVPPAAPASVPLDETGTTE